MISFPHVLRNQTYGESPRSADVSMAVNCNSSAGGPDCAGTTRRSEMLGTWPGIVIVTGAVRPAGNTISSRRSPGEAFSATSTVSSDQVSAPWKFSPRRSWGSAGSRVSLSGWNIRVIPTPAGSGCTHSPWPMRSSPRRYRSTPPCSGSSPSHEQAGTAGPLGASGCRSNLRGGPVRC